MSKKESRKRPAKTPARRGRIKVAAAVTLLLTCLLGTLLAQVDLPNEGKRDLAEVSIMSLSSNPKEYIYAGGRLVATEESTPIAPTYESFPGIGGNSSVAVTTQGAWTAVSDAGWIAITSGSSGNGNGIVTYSVAQNTTAAIRSATITIAGQTFTVYQGIDFADVPSTYLFYRDIGKLSARGVTLGCGGGNYCPDQPVLRDQMAAFIIRSLGDFNPPPPQSQRFADVSSSNPFFAFIEQMALRQITQGCGGGNYCPANPVLREQMAAFLIRALGDLNPPAPSSQRFNDVPSTNQFYAFIEQMAVRQITLGCSQSPPLYCPSDSVTRGQMAAFLVRAFKL